MIDKLGAGHYQTRDGRPVVILCLDAPGKFPVIGDVVTGPETSSLNRWHSDGSFYSEGVGSSDFDLIPVPRKPREVWISKRSLEVSNGFHNASEDRSWAEQPVLFREVMEDEA